MNLIELVYSEMTTDTDGDSRQAERLVRLYAEAGDIGKWHLDEAMMCLCGWTMKTLIQRQKAVSAITNEPAGEKAL